MQRRDLVVEDIALLVEPTLSCTDHVEHAARRDLLVVTDQLCRDLEHVQQPPGIAVGTCQQQCTRVFGNRHAIDIETTLPVCQCAIQDSIETRFIETLQHVDADPRQKRTDHLEGRILRRGANEHDGARFDVRQKRVLLGFVEPVHLVDEQHRRAARSERLTRGFDRRANLLHTR